MKLLCSLILMLTTHSLFSQNGMFDICPIKNSQEIPSAQVYNEEGSTLDLRSLVGDQKTVLVFYRGGWCGYCTQHLSALQDIKPQIDSLRYQIIGISPDSFIRLDSAMVRDEGNDFTLLSDKDAKAITAFGIGWNVTDELFEKYKAKYDIDLEWWSESAHHILPVPAIFIVEKGVIKYQHVDPEYSQRLSPEILLSLLKD